MQESGFQITFGGQVTYSSRIQLPTDRPPQLIPLTMLAASESFLGLSPLEAFVDIGCASVRVSESRRPNTLLIAPFDVPPLIFIAPDARVSFPVVGRSAFVEAIALDALCADEATSIGVLLMMLSCWSTPSSKQNECSYSPPRSSSSPKDEVALLEMLM